MTMTTIERSTDGDHLPEATPTSPTIPKWITPVVIGASVLSLAGAGMAAYAASKASVAALTQALSEELAGEEIWVNAIAPSILDTPANRAAMPNADYDRWVATGAAAELIAFLASPENRVTRGAVIPVYGGS